MEANALKLTRATTVAEMRERFSRFVTDAGEQRALSFKPGPDDVFVATYPKCGTTWMQQIVHGLRTRGSMDFDEITAVVPWLELAFDMGIDAEAPQVAAPRAFKTHLNWTEVPKGARYIYIIRDPRDVLVSFYRFLEGWYFEPGAITLEEFALQDFISGTESGTYWKHLASWWPQRTSSNVLMLSFEDMKQDLPQTVQRVAGFIGCDLDQGLQELVVQQSSVAFMKAHETRFDDHLIRETRDEACGIPPGGSSSKVRSGNVGDHATALTDEIIAALDRQWEENITATLGHASYAALRASLNAATE